MKNLLALLILCFAVGNLLADDITTLDGQKYENVRDVVLKLNGLFFVTGAGDSVRGVTVPYDNLPQVVKDKYHYDPYEMGFAIARQNTRVLLTKNLAFSLDDLEAAKKKAKDEHKMLGFIMEWDTLFIPSRPMGQGSNSGLVHFYDVFHDGLVLVFVRHESELDKVPGAVKQGFFGPDEGGFAPNMAVVTADCSQFVCEIPFGGNDSDGSIREKIFREKISVIKSFKNAQ
ncbi:MAG TPA: hypothetical protein VNU95_05535 [Candidatus Acidoferrales bacterium]|jgi:hypothetical protein|nr:hypothetical protein [Candidatus Acidoferrales bacterium]